MSKRLQLVSILLVGIFISTGNGLEFEPDSNLGIPGAERMMKDVDVERGLFYPTSFEFIDRPHNIKDYVIKDYFKGVNLTVYRPDWKAWMFGYYGFEVEPNVNVYDPVILGRDPPVAFTNVDASTKYRGYYFACPKFDLLCRVAPDDCPTPLDLESPLFWKSTCTYLLYI